MKHFDNVMHASYPEVVPANFFFEIGDGWHPLVGNLIGLINRRLDPSLDFRLEQVKEKYGELRFYYSGGDEFIYGMVAMAESLSTQICEVCGDRGERRNGSWIRTLCDHHEQEYQEKLKNAGRNT